MAQWVGVLAQWVGVQAQVKESKNTPTCGVLPGKPLTENEKCFFSISTTRLAESTVGLKSSLVQSPGELQNCKVLQEKWRTQDLKGL